MTSNAELKQFYARTNTDWALGDVPARAVHRRRRSRRAPTPVLTTPRAVQALYAVAYTIKFTSTRHPPQRLVVAPLEGLWWSDRPEVFTTAREGRLAMAHADQPARLDLPAICIDEAEQAAELAQRTCVAIADVRRRDAARSGPAAQLLHVGPYDDEGRRARRARINEYARRDRPANVRARPRDLPSATHRRTEPAELKTILRQPVQTARPPRSGRHRIAAPLAGGEEPVDDGQVRGAGPGPAAATQSSE